MTNKDLKRICAGLPIDPLPSPRRNRDDTVPHAPDRKPILTQHERKVRRLFYFRSPRKLSL